MQIFRWQFLISHLSIFRVTHNLYFMFRVRIYDFKFSFIYDITVMQG